MNELVVLAPVLKRPHRIRLLMESLTEATPEPHRILFLCDAFDEPTIREVASAGHDYGSVALGVVSGNYASKINAGVRKTSEPLLFLAADDLHFHVGWLEAAKAKMTQDIGVVGTNDLCNRRVMAGQHSTHSLVARWYAELGTIDEEDKLLHEGYRHEFVDDEFIATAKKREAFAHAGDSVVEHLHPMVGKAPMDDLYAEQRVRMRQGQRLFRRRQGLWT